ncbi:MAG: hypothetical protein QM535_18425 [Limnohabitans sp.]|nr:hypothetical protein [Limnohabitans sp.]
MFAFLIQANSTVKSNLEKTRLVSTTKIAFPDWGSYGGYLLFNDGCFHHGTFIWSGSPSNYVFVPDNGCNNDNSCSVGFEDFCMGEEEFSTFC